MVDTCLSIIMSTLIIRDFKKRDTEGKLRTFIEFKCDGCGEISDRPKRIFKNNSENFCSHKCWADTTSQRSMVNMSCSFCENLFKRRQSHLNKSKSGLYFCSRVCKDNAQRLENNFPEIRPDHYGSGITNYRNIAFRTNDKKCFVCGYDKYPEILQVHHIDRNRNNNTIENLKILCPTCHMEDHFLSGDGFWNIKKWSE